MNIPKNWLKTMQQDLFGKGGLQQPTALIITKKGKEQLSKNQQAFNKLTQRIEKLQKEIAKKQVQFDLALKIYGSEFYQALSNRLKTGHKLITVLWEIYQGQRLSKANQRELKSVLQHHLEQYFTLSDTEPDKTLQEIFSNIEGISYDKMMQDEKEKDTAAIKEMFDKIGVDTEGLDFEDDIAMAAKIAEANERMSAQEAAQARLIAEKEKRNAAKKNKHGKQQAYEKMQQDIAEAKKKNISTIYRQLAKLFHPDLEQDEERKLEKEVLMKELTEAFEAKNLHALLRLELKWIHRENDHLATLTDDKLNIYLEILKEQAFELENEKQTLVQHPQYAVLLNKFGYRVMQNPVALVTNEAREFAATAQNFEEHIALFESGNALKHVNEMIKQWKQGNTEAEEAEMLRMLMSGNW